MINNDDIKVLDELIEDKINRIMIDRAMEIYMLEVYSKSKTYSWNNEIKETKDNIEKCNIELETYKELKSRLSL